MMLTSAAASCAPAFCQQSAQALGVSGSQSTAGIRPDCFASTKAFLTLQFSAVALPCQEKLKRMSLQVVTGTGFQGEARSKFKEKLEALGLTYSGDLVLGSTDVLVCGEGTQLDSEKVVMARLWQLPIVTTEWLKTCQSAGRVVAAGDFLVDFCKEAAVCPDNTSSTDLPHSLGSLSYDYRSSYPPSRISRSRSSARDSSKHDSENPTSPKSPKQSSFFSEPFEVLRRMSSGRKHPKVVAGPDNSAFEIFGEADLDDAGPSMALTLQDQGSSHEHHVVHAAVAIPAMPPSPDCLPIPDPSPPPISPPNTIPERLQGLSPLQKLSVADVVTECSPVVQKLQEATPSSSQGAGGGSPPSVVVKVGGQLQRAPKKTTAASFHGCPVKRLTFYNDLEVHDTVQGTRLHFSMRDHSHCALVYYDDSADGHELAYCDLLNTYATADGQIWVEHGYLFDAADLQAHPTGCHLQHAHPVANDELVNSVSIYHSPARVIEGEFRLYGSQAQAQKARQLCKDENQLFMFTTRTWDRRAGRFLPQTKRVQFYER